MKKITIAIDGYSSTGKSTVAKQLANALGYVYVDTGAMYRAITLYAMRKGYVGNAIANIKTELDHIELNFKHNGNLGYCEMFLNEENVEREIRTLSVSKYVSKIAEILEVREKLVNLQKQMGKEKGIVMDGRDIGTVVFPDAELKIFMTASAEKRAQRRYQELLDRGEEVTFDEVLKNVEERDYIDSHREFSPLKKAKDAVIMDNSNMNLEEQFKKILELAANALEGK